MWLWRFWRRCWISSLEERHKSHEERRSVRSVHSMHSVHSVWRSVWSFRLNAFGSGLCCQTQCLGCGGQTMQTQYLCFPGRILDDISIPYTVGVYLWALIHPSWSNADLFPRTENAFMTLMSKKQSSRHPEITYWGIEMWKGNLVYNVPLRHITRSATELLATLVKVESNGSGQVGCSWVASGWNLDRQCFLGALRFTLRVLKFPRTHFGRSFGHERSSELSERAWRQRQFLGVDFGLWKEVSGSKYVCSLAIGSNVWIAWTEASCDFWVLMSIFIINPCDSESFPGAGWWRAWTGASWNAQ